MTLNTDKASLTNLFKQHPPCEHSVIFTFTKIHLKFRRIQIVLQDRQLIRNKLRNLVGDCTNRI